MTPRQALEILATATEPQNANRITREGYAQISQALKVLAQLIDQLQPDERQHEGSL